MAERCQITTHVLDVERGVPGCGIAVTLLSPDGRKASGVTNADGRITEFIPDDIATVDGIYKLTFATGEYSDDIFFPEITVAFKVTGNKYHIPLLLSKYSYTTYKGS